MKEIVIFLYSYKNNNLIDIVANMVDSYSNKNRIRLYVYDQNNIDRTAYFKNIPSVKYSHIYWDSYFPITEYRKDIIKKDYDYYVEVSDSVELKKDWDLYLVDNFTNIPSVVFSGNKEAKLITDGFYVKNLGDCSNFVFETNWIDMDFIAIDKKNISSMFEFNNQSLKKYGQDLLLSLTLIKDNTKIFSLGDKVYTNKAKLKIDYLPYSENHNYKKIYKYFNTDVAKRFNSIHNIIIENLKIMKFETNDVEYIFKTQDFNLDRKGVGRFHNGYNSIYHISDIMVEEEKCTE